MPFYVSWSGKVVQPFNQWWRCLLILGDTRKMVLLISIWYSFKYIIVLIVWNPFNDDDIDDSSGNLLFAENWRLQGFWGGFDEKSIQAGTLVFASKSFEAAKSFRFQIFPWNIPISDMIIFYMCLFFQNVFPFLLKMFSLFLNMWKASVAKISDWKWKCGFLFLGSVKRENIKKGLLFFLNVKKDKNKTRGKLCRSL